MTDELPWQNMNALLEEEGRQFHDNQKMCYGDKCHLRMKKEQDKIAADLLVKEAMKKRRKRSKLAENADIHIAHVKAHVGVEVNETADVLADKGRQLQLSQAPPDRKKHDFESAKSVCERHLRWKLEGDMREYAELNPTSRTAGYVAHSRNFSIDATRYLKEDAQKKVQAIINQLVLGSCEFGGALPNGGCCKLCGKHDVSPGHFVLRCQALDAWRLGHAGTLRWEQFWGKSAAHLRYDFCDAVLAALEGKQSDS